MSEVTMATIASPEPSAVPKLRLKYLLWGFIGLMFAYVLWHDESFVLNSADPAWAHYQPFKWYLLPHAIAGMTVILLGPLQFSDRIRRNYRKVHRVSGRIYVGAALILAPIGVYIQWFNERLGATRTFTIATTFDAFLTMATTAIAFGFILNGKVQQHREWMTRSYACALIFIEVRVVGGLTGLDQNPASIETIVWGGVGMALFLAQIVIEVGRMRRVSV
jgi:uncharacterized membrane protein